MITTHPSIMLGSYVWDQDWLPGDEFRLRSNGLDRIMERQGWQAMLVCGDAREHACLAWVSNFIPRMRWGMALVPRQSAAKERGEPRLLASMSSRDIPAMRTMTWIGDVVSGWEWKHFDSWAANLEPGSVIGTAGFDLITPLLFSQVEKSLAGRATLADADAPLAELRRVQRPREVALIRRSADIAAASATALARGWRMDVPAETALLEAERAARGMAAQDVRMLLSTDGGRTLRPYRGTFDERPEAVLAYIGVKLLGYWSESFVTLSRPARRIDGLIANALDGLIDAARPGVTGAELLRRGEGMLDGGTLHPALGGSVGCRIGLSIGDGAPFGRDATEPLLKGNVYALRIGAIDPGEGGAIASAMVHVAQDGTRSVLCRSAVPA